MKVLVVDDEALVARANARVLRGAGFEVEVVNGFSGALGALEMTYFDVVLSDYDLEAGRTGQEVRGVAAAHGTPTVLYTGRLELPEAPYVLSKPAGVSEIVAKLLQAVKGRAL
jgi:DNA-binding NtrC family response regulator